MEMSSFQTVLRTTGFNGLSCDLKVYISVLERYIILYWEHPFVYRGPHLKQQCSDLSKCITSYSQQQQQQQQQQHPSSSRGMTSHNSEVIDLSQEILALKLI